MVLRIAVADTNPGAGGDTMTPLLDGPPSQRFAVQSAALQTIAVTIQVAASDALQPLAGNSGDATWTGGGGDWVASTIGIRPAPPIVDVDLSISKNDNETKVNPGDIITYSIVASNVNGPGVTGAAVVDMFPASLTCNWTCSGSGGGSCAPNGSGDISDTVNLPTAATVTYSATCTVSGTASGSIMNTATITAPLGTNDTDSGNNDSTDTTLINQAPVAQCQNVKVDANDSCVAAANIDNGSFDPDNDLPLVISQDPAGPYSLGDTSVELTVTDDLGLSDMCTATVTVQDVTDPVVSCNTGSGTIIPSDAPISFTATAEDNCSVASVALANVECFFTNGAGKIIDKSESCVVSLSGDTITISDSGGVDTMITWDATATDGSNNQTTESCKITVLNPTE